MKRKLLASLLVMCMVFSLIPATVFAEETTYVAKIGDTNYESLEAAITAAEPGDEIVLCDNITASTTIVINKAITLNGNGYTLTSTMSGASGRAINVREADGVTIKNLTINASGERAINIIQNATNVTIDNVTATANNYTVNIATSAPNAVVTIKNSTLTGKCTVNVSAYAATVTVDNSTVNCVDNDTTAGEGYSALSLNKEAEYGSIVATNTTVNVTEGSDSYKGRNGGDYGVVTINGSTDDVLVINTVITYPGPYYHGFASISAAMDFAKESDNVSIIRDVEEDFTVSTPVIFDLTGKTYTGTITLAADVTFTAPKGLNVVSGVEGYEVEYKDGAYKLKKLITTADDLIAAIAAAEPGDTIVLGGSFAVSTNVVINKKITLDLNGYVITGTDTTSKNFGLIDVVVGGDFTLEDSSEAGTGKITLTSTTNSGWNRYAAVISNARGVVTVNGGTIENLGGTDMAYGIDTLTNTDSTNATTIINGGVITSTYRALRQFNNSRTGTAKIVINGGVIEGANKGIFFHDPSTHDNLGVLEINGGTVNSVYLFVTEGSPAMDGVSVSIKEGTVAADAITTKNFVEGKVLALINGEYVIHSHEINKAAAKAPTCEEEGIEAHYVCSVCGTLFSDEAGATEVTEEEITIAKLSHDFGEWKITTYATCTEAGSESRTCADCGEVETNTISATGHYYGEWKITTAATCTKEGVQTRACSCGATETITVAATGHSYGEWKVTTAATCAKEGVETRTCTCGAKETRSIAKTTEHTYGEDGKCTVCGAADPNYVAPTEPTTSEMPKEVDKTITEVVVKEEVVEAVKDTVVVTEGTATVEKEAIEAVVEAAKDETTVVLPLAQTTEETVTKAEVNTEALTAVADEDKDVVIEFTDATVKLDLEAVKAVTEQAKGNSIEIRVVTVETTTLTEEQQAAIAEKETAIVVTAQIYSDGEYIGDFKGGTATVMLPFEVEEGKNAEDYTVYYVDENGKLVEVAAEYVDGHMVFTTAHFSDYVIVYEGEAKTPSAPATEESKSILPLIIAVILIVVIVIAVVILVLKKKKTEG